jgi:hypothetical protein
LACWHLLASNWDRHCCCFLLYLFFLYLLILILSFNLTSKFQQFHSSCLLKEKKFQFINFLNFLFVIFTFSCHPHPSHCWWPFFMAVLSLFISSSDLRRFSSSEI